MTPPMISVILPFYNAGETLADAIDSIRKQTFDDWELLLFDDGSTDNSLSVAEQLLKTCEKIRIVGTERVGIVAALQRMCRKASGAFLVRMDADDISHSRRFEQQLGLMQLDETIALCGCCVRSFGEELGEGGQQYYEWINALLEHESITREIFIECPIAHPTFFMRREWYERIGGYEDNGWAEDYDLILRLWEAGARFAKVPEHLLDWRNTADRLSLTDPRYSLDNFRALKRRHIEQSILPRAVAESRQFFQWGAGEVGKRWLREWGAIRPEAVVDIHPRKVGTRIHGYTIIWPDDLAPPGKSFILIAVGAPGARDEIRAWLNPRGYAEEKDYLFIA